MGSPHYSMIPAAILLDNPGITREEFVHLLNSTRLPKEINTYNGSGFSKVKMKGHYGYYDFYRGLFGLAKILSLTRTQGFLEIEHEEIRDDQGFQLLRPELTVSPRFIGSELVQKYIVREHKRNILSRKTSDLEFHHHEKLREGSEFFLGEKRFGIEEILEKEYSRKRDYDERYFYRVRFREIKKEVETHKFDSIEDLSKSFPKLNPDFVFDFSSTEGEFNVGFLYTRIYWRKANGKYYFDEEKTFNKMGASLSPTSLGWGYTDLILTAEAVSNRNWMILYERNLLQKTVDYMFRRNPEALKRYERAIWDSHSSLFAKSEGLTHSQFLRWRQIAKLPFNELKYEDEI